MADDNVLDQEEIQRLLNSMGGGAAPAPPPSPPSPPPAAAAVPAAEDGILSQDELNALFSGGAAPVAAAPPPVVPDPAAKPAMPTPLPPPVMPPPAAAPAPSAAPAFTGWNTAPAAFDPGDDDEEGVPRGDLDYLQKRADESLRSIAATPAALPSEVIEFQFPEFGGTVPSTEHVTLDQISEVDLDVKVELGRTYMYLEDVLKLRKGAVVPLDKMAGETVDIYINGRLLARGEVLVMNENFCVRIAELLAGAIPME
ncbi:MAG: flagellar motor switch protein FliN [Planctomycetaceae bacterium]|jgi:flagellar motor switch protein FliN/FliY|nr:flagellar motor switch protein FliN [Planctomycetaceae bacterium]